MIRIIISEHFVFAANTQGNFCYHCEDCLKYCRSNVELQSTVLSAVPTPMSISNRQIDLHLLPLFILISLVILWLLLKLEHQKHSPKLVWSSLLDFIIIIGAAGLSASF